jgi:hypothetical protein
MINRLGGVKVVIIIVIVSDQKKAVVSVLYEET